MTYKKWHKPDEFVADAGK